MQPLTNRPRARLTIPALENLRAEVKGGRALLVSALNAIRYDLPREAGGLLDVTVPGYPNCFLWRHPLDDEGVEYELKCIVSRTGWPDNLWVMDVFVS